MEDYRTIRGTAVGEYEEKKSRFIAQLSFADSEEKAVAFLEQVRAANRTARHNVYAYRLREGSRERYSDDGEPAKTAGTPALEVLQHSGLTDLIVVITRYFGGVLLGAGGLVRAYSEAAAKALDAAGLCQYVPVVRWGFAVDYAHWARLDRFLQSSDIQLEQTDYGAEVLCQGLSREEAWEPFRQALYNHCDGRVEVQFAEHAIAPWPID